MKIRPAHYAFIRNAFATVPAETITKHRAFIVKEGKAKDIEKRLRWDLAYSLNLSTWLCSNVYDYADDSHIDTALRSIMRELNA